MITLNDIRKHRPCEDGWRKLLAHLGKTAADNDPLSLAVVLDSNGLDDTLWCLRALPADMDNAVRLLVCDLVAPAMAFTTDPRPAEALRVARAFANETTTRKELAAAGAAKAAWAAAGAAMRDAAWAAAWAAVGDAAWDAAWAAAMDAAGAAAWAAAMDAQSVTLRAWIVKNNL